MGHNLLYESERKLAELLPKERCGERQKQSVPVQENYAAWRLSETHSGSLDAGSVRMSSRNSAFSLRVL